MDRRHNFPQETLGKIAQDQDILEGGLFNKLHQSTADDDDDDEKALLSLKNIPEFQELSSLQTFRKGDH